MAKKEEKAPERAAIDYTKMNVLQKLALARLRFLEEGTKKSGKNIKLEFSYFELSDIVPVATKIFAELGLVSTVSFDMQSAEMMIYNADDPNEKPVCFLAPYREVDPIVSKAGSVVTNAVQIVGMSITYYRRYLYMMALDIVEADSFDATVGEPVPEEKPKAPATKEERKAAKQKLVEEETLAPEAQVAELKDLCKQLIEADPEQKDFVMQIAEKTNGFEGLTTSVCTAVSGKLREMLAEYGGE